MRREHAGFKSEKSRFSVIKSSPYSKTLISLVFATLALAPVIGWIVFERGEPDEVRTYRAPDALQPRYSNALASPAADQLEDRISSLTGNMKILSDLITDLESKLIATDKLEERISGLTENLGTLSSLTTDLESRQMATDKLAARISGLAEEVDTLDSLTSDIESREIAANKLEARISGLTGDMETLNSLTADLESRQKSADKLEARIANITKDLQILSDMAASIESTQRAALASTNTVVPAKQKLRPKTSPPLPAIAKTTPAVKTPAVKIKPAAAPATPTPKPVTDSQAIKRETLSAVPKDRGDSVVKKQPTGSAPQNRPWNINLMSSPDKAYAIRFSDTAQSKGIQTELQEAIVKGTTYWRVQVRGFATHDEAKAYADTIKDTLGLQDNAWIMKR